MPHSQSIVRPSRYWRVIAAAVACCLAGQPGASAQPPTLHIVVVEGEDAVNIVRQKTAVAPIVEVRDRNDQPVAGALVQFAIRSGRASFGGARTVAVTTNAAGRAAASGFTPSGTGALQITATASFEGQTAAVVTIAQTTVATAAAAGGGAGAAGSAAGSGAGGGISATTIAIVGAAVGGGAYAVNRVVNGGASGTAFSGPFSGILTEGPPSRSCTRDERHAGTIVMHLDVSSSGTVTGTADTDATYTSLSTTGSGCAAGVGNTSASYGDDDIPVTGTSSKLGFNFSRAGVPGVTITFTFTGTLTGDQIVGTYTENWLELQSGFGGAQSFPVTLTKQ
jgi:hypothetical protein